jgi:hypothetical protein
MNPTNLFLPILLFFVFFIPERTLSQSKHQTEWILSKLMSTKTEGIRITGNPQVVDCKYGKAVLFNGATDGIFLDQMPLVGLKQFTIEVIMRPEIGGNFEQRFFHCGEIRGDRVLLELRSTKTDWYFDAFITSRDQKKTLIEPTLIHPLDQWYHLAFVVANGRQETYINGKKEMESQIEIIPLQGGKTSIGVRQNEQSWFKGEIYKIRISPEALSPAMFMNF